MRFVTLIIPFPPLWGKVSAAARKRGEWPTEGGL